MRYPASEKLEIIRLVEQSHLPVKRTLAETAGFMVEFLEKQEKQAHFKSIKELMEVHITGGMRTADGNVFMGIFDLEDETYEPKNVALLDDLRAALNKYESSSGIKVPWASDVLVARA